MISSDEEGRECGTCLTDLMLSHGNIHQCPEGHLQCADCYGRLGGAEAQCPACGTPMLCIRNRYMEKQRALRRLPRATDSDSLSSLCGSLQEQLLQLVQERDAQAAIERSRSEQIRCLSGEATHGAHTKLEEERRKSQEEQGEADVMRAEETSSALHNRSKREKRKPDSSRRREAQTQMTQEQALNPRTAVNKHGSHGGASPPEITEDAQARQQRASHALGFRNAFFCCAILIPVFIAFMSKPGEVGPQKYQTAATTAVVLQGARGTVASHVPAHMFPYDPALGSHVPAASSNPRVVGVDAVLLEKKRSTDVRNGKAPPQTLTTATSHTPLPATSSSTIAAVTSISSNAASTSTMPVADLIAILARHSSSPSDAQKAVEAVGGILALDEPRKTVVKAGGMLAIVEAMKTHAKVARVQLVACTALTGLIRPDLTMHSKSAQKAIAKAGGIKVVLNAMRAHRGEADVQQECLTAIAQLAFRNIRNQKKIVKFGGILAVVETMRAHPAHARVQGEACGAMLALSLAIDAADAAAHISSQASVSLSANAAKRNTGLAASAPDVHLLQIEVVMLAGPEPAPTTTTLTRPSASMTCSSAPAPTFTNNPEAIAEAGGIAAVTEAMRMHPGEMTVQRNGGLALANLAVTSVNRNMIGAADGVAMVLMALKMHQTPEVQAVGCRALMNLATDNDRNSKAIAEAGGINLVLHAMRGLAQEPSVQTWGCGALAQLAINNKQNQDAITAAGGIAAVVNAMEMTAVVGVQQQGCLALYTLAVNNVGNQREVLSSNAISVVVAGLKAHPGEFFVQERGCYLLANLHNHLSKSFYSRQNLVRDTGLRKTQARLRELLSQLCSSVQIVE